MDLSLVGAVGAGGLVGAPARLLVDRAVSDRAESPLPLGTMAVNVSGSLVFGLVSGLSLAHHLGPVLVALVGTGFCGAFTTFSTFTAETLRLMEDGELLQAAITVVASVAAGLAAAAAGVAAGLAT